MNVPSWLTSVRHLFQRHQSAVIRRHRRRERPGVSHQAERLEERRLLAFDFVAAFVQPGEPFYTANVSPSEVLLTAAPQQITLRFSPGVEIDSSSLDSITVVRSGRGGDPFEPSISSQREDVAVEIGSITVNDAPNQNEVIIRFAESLPDDTYRIDIGAGLLTETGDAVNPASFDIRLNLGAHVVSVVPQPVIRAKTVEFKALPADGDLLTVSVRGKQMVLEFDSDDTLSDASHTRVTFSNASTVADVAAAARAAVLSGPDSAPADVFAAELADATISTATLTITGESFTPVVSATRAGTALAATVITIGDGALSHLRDAIVVYFNANDPLSLSSAQTAANYRLVETNATTGASISVALPTGVSYDASSGTAVLTFAGGAVADDRLYRLQVGNLGSVAGAAVVAVENEPGGTSRNSSYSAAQGLGQLRSAGAQVTGTISRLATVATPAGNLPFPTQPGSIDEVGHRDIPDSLGESHGDAEAGAGNASNIRVQEYNFQSYYGDDPQGNPLFNAITETQKQRAREIFDLYSQYTGIRFVETASQGITVITGDMRAISPSINTAPAGLAGTTNLGLPAAIMDSTDNWGVSEYGGSWFRVAMHEIGHALGLEHSYDIPSIMGNGLSGEPVFPGDYDLVHMDMLYPKTGSDIDVYSFTLGADGRLTAETVVARPGTSVTSYLDTVITLFREVKAGGVTTREMVARNDDYYGRDSFIGLDLAAADGNGNSYTYYVAVTSTGNTDYNLEVENSGYGGRTQGTYSLRLGFEAVALSTETIVDASGTALDGDRDGQAGGKFDFWFNTAAAGKTVYVDKASPAAGAVGTLANPYTELDVAIAAVNAANAAATGSKTILRIVGNDGNAASLTDGNPYLVGRAQGQTGTVLQDGATFNVPRGVTAIIDEGAVFKLRGAVIDVGSASTQPSESRVGASIQVLGTPVRQVKFTSYHDDQWGGNSDGTGPAAAGGQWGGIVLRQDSDIASKLAFVNAITNAEFRYGGGQVSVNSQLRSFTPIQLESTRPTIAFNRITQSAGAAISADPNSFDDSNGRIGPELRGNLLTGNSINGVFVRVTTSPGSAIAKLTVPARFKSTDIVYVMAENFVIDGGAGGYLDDGANIVARSVGRLAIDPGVVVKLVGSRIELERGGSRLYAEGLPASRVIFTSLADNRFGAGGTFDTNGNQPDTPAAGDWAGIVLNAGAAASIDNAYVGFGGGASPIEGTVASFNVLEAHQGDLRLANSRVENNAAGYSAADGVRTGRGTNAAATIFVRGAQPVIVGNDFRDNRGAIVSINANALNDRLLGDYGRSTGEVNRVASFDANFGPLVRGNVLSYTIDVAAGRPAGGATGGMEVRAEEITVEAIWDDTDIVHVLRNEIVVNNFHTATGLQLRSQPNASLVVKLLGANAGLTAAGFGLQIDDRIGGTVQILGQPGYPVVMTSLHDDTVYASLDPLGIPVRDTGNNEAATTSGPGDWRGLRFLSMSNDRNVATISERELTNTGGVVALQLNGDVDSAQVLGVLAPNFRTTNAQGSLNSWESVQEKGGDNVRRLGFEVNGTISFDDPTDVDVYSFQGYAGSEVWIDIDKTSPSLDAMVELLDANGNVLARSADALNDIGVVSSDAPDVVVESPGGQTVVAGATEAVLGSVAVATGVGAVVLGETETALGSVALADGVSAVVQGDNRTVLGSVAAATGVAARVLGETEAILGVGARVAGTSSRIIGVGTKVDGAVTNNATIRVQDASVARVGASVFNSAGTQIGVVDAVNSVNDTVTVRAAVTLADGVPIAFGVTDPAGISTSLVLLETPAAARNAVPFDASGETGVVNNITDGIVELGTAITVTESETIAFGYAATATAIVVDVADVSAILNGNADVYLDGVDTGFDVTSRDTETGQVTITGTGVLPREIAPGDLLGFAFAGTAPASTTRLLVVYTTGAFPGMPLTLNGTSIDQQIAAGGVDAVSGLITLTTEVVPTTGDLLGFGFTSQTITLDTSSLAGGLAGVAVTLNGVATGFTVTSIAGDEVTLSGAATVVDGDVLGFALLAGNPVTTDLIRVDDASVVTEGAAVFVNGVDTGETLAVGGLLAGDAVRLTGAITVEDGDFVGFGFVGAGSITTTRVRVADTTGINVGVLANGFAGVPSGTRVAAVDVVTGTIELDTAVTITNGDEFGFGFAGTTVTLDTTDLGGELAGVAVTRNGAVIAGVSVGSIVGDEVTFDLAVDVADGDVLGFAFRAGDPVTTDLIRVDDASVVTEGAAVFVNGVDTGETVAVGGLLAGDAVRLTGAITVEDGDFVGFGFVGADSITTTRVRVADTTGINVGVLANGFAGVPSGTRVAAVDVVTGTIELDTAVTITNGDEFGFGFKGTTISVEDAAGIVTGVVVGGAGITLGTTVANVDLGNTTISFSQSVDLADGGSIFFLARSFALANRNILPGTLAGVIYEDNTAIQTFTVARDGTFMFTRIGDPTSEALAAASGLDRDAGVITLGFDVVPIGTIRIEASYEFSRLPLATLGFTAAGSPLGAGEHGAFSLTKDQWRGNDTHSTNPRDPGMRVILPGVAGDLSRYFIRVRSQAATTAAAGLVQYATDLATTTAGATSGHYQLRLRLRQQDEKPGSTVSYADIRYPVVGIDVVGLPRNSPLVGENGEEQTDTNDELSGSQQLGNLLATDRNTISVAGAMADAGDVDWYTFTLDYTDIQWIDGVSTAAGSWATMFDIDYADGFRGDLTLSVFDNQGRLLYVGRDSDIADDQPGVGQADDFDDLSRGSLGKLDPFIGSVQMPVGGPDDTTRYYVAVHTNERLPDALDQTFRANPTNPLIRLEPISSVTRVVDDRIGSTGSAEAGSIIDVAKLATHVRPFTLSDVTLYVTTSGSLHTVDAMRGQRVTTVAGTGGADIDMRSDGRLFQVIGVGGDAANVATFRELDPGTGAVLSSQGDGVLNIPIPIPPATLAPTDTWQMTSDSVDAVAIRRTGVGQYADVFYSLRGRPAQSTQGSGSFLYKGTSAGVASGTAGRRGRITDDDGSDGDFNGGVINVTTGMQFQNESGTLFGVSDNGFFYNIDTGTGRAGADILVDFSGVPVPGGGTLEGFEGLATAPVNLEGGRYAGSFFAITTGGRLVCITDGDRNAAGFQPALMANVFDTDADGYADSYVSNVVDAGATGLAFSPLDINLWHSTNLRGTSMYFGLEERGSTANPQYGAAGGAWQQDLTANSAIGDNYNVPGGAHGSLVTNAFSLAGYSYTDKPTLYFNYFLETEGDWARVRLSTDGGVTWELLATNGTETPPTLSVSSAIADPVVRPNQHVQPLFDSTGSWRQARVDLGKWAGESNIQLRFDFSTTGAGLGAPSASWSAPDALRTVPGGAATTATTLTLDSVDGLHEGMFVRSPLDTAAYDTGAVPQHIPSNTTILAIDVANGTITLSNPVDKALSNNASLQFFREQITTVPNPGFGASAGTNNNAEGFYVDDIIVGFAERGEMVMGAVANQSAITYSPNTPTTDGYFQQVLKGAYQLEIRRGTEYASQTFDTNDRLVRSAADTVRVLEQNAFMAIGGAITRAGNGQVSITGDVDDGILLSGVGGPASPTEHNLLSWAVDLANQPSAFLEFQYRTAASETLVSLPDTFVLDANAPIPFGDGVAVSVDGGVTWTRIAGFTATQGAWRQVRLDLIDAFGGPLSATTRIGFFQSGASNELNGGGIAIRGVLHDPGTWLDVPVGGDRNVLITTSPRLATSGFVGDSDFLREQGQFIVENNIISNASQYGIRVDAADRTAGTNAPTPGVVRNLPTINADRLVPGAVISNNVILGSGSAGILFSGQTNASTAPNAAVPFGRIVNNTIYGGETPAGTGVQVTDNAGPTLLNNIFAGLATGVEVADAGSRAQTVVGYSAYYNTTQAISGGSSETNAITLSANPFVNIAGRNFYLAAGSLAIDSSLDVLQDREDYRVVKDVVGIPASPILAPDYDLYGQLRLDDPGVAGGAPGLGLNVFKDRGAVERADFTQPVVSLIVPNTDGATIHLQQAAARGQSQFVLQLADAGAGIDDSTVSSAAFVVRYRPLVSDDAWSSEQILVAGTDYVFTYLENTKTVVFEAPAVFDFGQYLIVADNTVIRDRAGNGLLNNDLIGDGTTAFAIGLSDAPAAPDNLRAVLDEDGEGTLSATLTWDAAAANGRALIDYTITEANGMAPIPTPVVVPGDTNSYTISGLTLNTTYSLTVRARNALGSSEDSIAVTFVARPLPRFRLEADSGVVGDNVTNDPTIDVYEGLLSTDTWEYSFDGGTTWLAGAGDLKFDLPEDGTYAAGSIGVRQVVAGLPAGARFSTAAIVLDRVVATPTVTLRHDTGSSSSDGVTNDGAVDVALLEDGGSWEYSVDGGANWLPGTGADFELDEGVYAAGNVMVRQTDLAANQSESAALDFGVDVDTTSPSAVSWAIADSGVPDDFITNSSLVTIDLDAVEEGGFWQYSNSQSTNGSYVLGTGGSFNLPVGESFGFVRQIDLAGNIGPETRYPAEGMVTLDTSVATPVLTLRADTGISSTDRITRDGTINVAGLEAGTWEFRTNATAAWMPLEASSFVLADGYYASGQVQVRQTDLAGNASAVGVLGIAVTVDTTISEPSAMLAEDTGRSSTDRITRNGRINVRNDAGTTWRYSLNAGATWTNGVGTFFTLPAGTYAADTVLVEQADKAGNTAYIALPDIVVDQIAAKPVLALQEDTGNPADGITANGRVNVTNLESGASWEFSTNSGTTWTRGPAEVDGASFFTLLPRVYSRNVIRVRQTDIAGNVAPIAAYPTAVTVDTSTPAVTRVTSSASNGVYGFGRITAIPIQVTFTKPVIVSDGGSLVLELNTSPARSAVYTRGSGTNTLTFTYTIQEGDSSQDLGYLSTSSLVGGTIVNGAGTTADRTLPALGNRLSLDGGKAIVVQTVISAVAKIGTLALSTSSGSPTPLAAGPRDVTITFNTSVIGVSLANVRLLRDGVPVALTSVSVRRLSSTTYRLSLPASVTETTGDYTLEIGGPSSTIKSGLRTMTVASAFHWQRA